MLHLCFSFPSYIMLYHAMLYYANLYFALWYCVIPCRAVQHYATLYDANTTLCYDALCKQLPLHYERRCFGCVAPEALACVVPAGSEHICKIRQTAKAHLRCVIFCFATEVHCHGVRYLHACAYNHAHLIGTQRPETFQSNIGAARFDGVRVHIYKHSHRNHQNNTIINVGINIGDNSSSNSNDAARNNHCSYCERTTNISNNTDH